MSGRSGSAIGFRPTSYQGQVTGLEKVNHWLALVANLGVIAGILFLGIEIQQSNRIAVASTEIEIRSSYAMLNQSIIADADLARIFIEAESNDAELSAIDQLRLSAWVTQLANQWMAMETAFKNEMVPRETFEVIFDDQRWLINRFPATRPLLRGVVDNYRALSGSEAFTSADRLLKEHSA